MLISRWALAPVFCLAEQRKLLAQEVVQNAVISSTTPYGSRRYANKVSANWR